MFSTHYSKLYSVMLALVAAVIVLMANGQTTAQSTVAAARPTEELFRASSIRLSSEQMVGYARARAVTVNHAALGVAADPFGETISLNLFDDLTITAVRYQQQVNATGSITWLGHVDGYNMSDVILTLRDGNIYGSVTLAGVGEFAVAPMGGGQHMVQQAGPFTVLPTDDTHYAEGFGPNDVHPADGPREAAFAADDGSLIDVLVVYDNTDVDGAGSDEAVAQADAESYAEQFMAYTNLAYENSNINQRVWLVGTIGVSYDDTNSLSSDLSAVKNGSVANVHALRDEYHADLVLFFVARDGSGSNSCSGLAYLQTSVTSSFEQNGYGTMKACSFGKSVFAHELGHNMGSRHDWYVDSNTTPFSTAHGFVSEAGQWRTIMAYSNRCTAESISCDRVAHFSNPDINYNGAATGVASGTSSACSIGDKDPGTECDADAAETFDNTAANTAGFRSSQLTWTGAVSGDWNTAGNWTIDEGASGSTTTVNRVPRSIDNIIIPSGTPNAPAISSGSMVAREVIIASGATLDMTGGTLTVGWKWQDNGGFNGTGGTVVFSGPLGVDVTSAASSTFTDVQIGDGTTSSNTTLNSNIDINGNLSMMANATLVAGSNTVNVAGNWNEADASGFSSGTSTVIFDGTAQSVTKTTAVSVMNETMSNADGDSCCGSANNPVGWTREHSTGFGFMSGDPGSGGELYAWNDTPDAWIFTDAKMLSAGVNYSLSYDYRVNNSGTSSNISFHLSTSASSGGVTSQIDSVTASSTTYATDTGSFTVGTSGTYYIGIRVQHATGAPYTRLDNIIINGSSGISFYNAQVASGVTTFGGDVAVTNNLQTDDGGTADFSTNAVTVEGTVTNNGALRQTMTAAASTQTDYLFIKNAANATTKYQGLSITPGATALGSTIVTITGNRQSSGMGGCTNSANSLIDRCFNVVPATSASADYKFYYSPGESNSHPEDALVVWYQDTSDQLWKQHTNSGITYSNEVAGSCSVSANDCWVQMAGATLTNVTRNVINNYYVIGLTSSDQLAVEMSSAETTTDTATLVLVSLTVLLGATAVVVRRRNVA